MVPGTYAIRDFHTRHIAGGFLVVAAVLLLVGAMHAAGTVVFLAGAERAEAEIVSVREAKPYLGDATEAPDGWGITVRVLAPDGSRPTRAGYVSSRPAIGQTVRVYYHPGGGTQLRSVRASDLWGWPLRLARYGLYVSAPGFLLLALCAVAGRHRRGRGSDTTFTPEARPAGKAGDEDDGR